MGLTLIFIKKAVGKNVQWNIKLTGSKFVVSEFAKFVYGSIGKPPNKIHKQLDSFYIAYGGTILPAKIAKVLYDESLVYLDRKKELANHIIGEYL